MSSRSIDSGDTLCDHRDAHLASLPSWDALEHAQIRFVSPAPSPCPSPSLAPKLPPAVSSFPIVHMVPMFHAGHATTFACPNPPTVVEAAFERLDYLSPSHKRCLVCKAQHALTPYALTLLTRGIATVYYEFICDDADCHNVWGLLLCAGIASLRREHAQLVAERRAVGTWHRPLPSFLTQPPTAPVTVTDTRASVHFFDQEEAHALDQAISSLPKRW